SKWDRYFVAIVPRINRQRRRACGVRWQNRRASAGIGPSAMARSMRSTPRLMRWRCSPPPVRQPLRCKPCRGARPGFIPGVPERFESGPKNVLGISGNLHPARFEALAAEGRLVRSEVILERFPEPRTRGTRAKPVLELPPLQPVQRDFAFVVDREVKAADIVRAAQSVDRKLITGITVFDVYEGQGIAPGKKSIAIAVTLQPRERTMTDAEIEALAAKIVAEVGKRTGGALRG